MLAIKRKLNNVSLIPKCKINQLIEKRMNNEAASAKFGIPRSTILTWMKNKKKLLQSLGQTLSNAKKLREYNYEQVDKAILKWFFLQSSRNIPIDGTMIQEKVLLFSQNFNFPNVKCSDGWIDKSQKGMEKYRTTVKKVYFSKLTFYRYFYLRERESV